MQTPDHTPLTQLSPLRNSTSLREPGALAEEQLEHFGIEPASPLGRSLGTMAARLYEANAAAHDLWRQTLQQIDTLDRADRIAYFNAKRFLCFQVAKILDNLQNPLRASYQSIATRQEGFACKGPFPLFDNVTALFSANPVVARTATYLFACTEWVEDAFTGREPLHEIYSRLLNPTSISLANHIVDIECGADADRYLAWNFNSGMAAIDGLLANLVGARDIILSSRNVYGGTYQLLHDWYGKRSNLDTVIAWFDGFDGASFEAALDRVEREHANRLAEGRRIYVYLESPCNPHGTVLDVAAISRIAHARGWLVLCDATVGTPFLHRVMKHRELAARPDFVVHSYTKDLTGGGSTTAGVVIGRNERMFMPKGESVTIEGVDGKPETIGWEETLFWNVYYIKGAFLDADKAYEVLTGLKTFELRMLSKAVNTLTLARLLSRHPSINVNCPAVPGHPNAPLLEKRMFLGLPAPLFTFDFEGGLGQPGVPRETFKRFFDSLEPAVGLQVTLGQNNTVALCPAQTSHSELSEDALREAGIRPTTVRLAVGLEDPRALIVHLKRAAEVTIDPAVPGFSAGFPDQDEIDRVYRETYLEVHRRFIEAQPDLLSLAA
jgi:O-acetylhomoserine/O-acetylserine sulfhydrylase-like pyridoxal-dependent enzyme